ncbi:putative precursor of iron transport multicopper oxidase FET3 [Triangularia verruculosa]|uniref:Precursor of iron transport multicopper oxidase FET3 n=1 Tax=Triangularia verruculosa TaxID=2587418 RepID=A0AAN6XSK2_9PEZI|nr:putative precursor of iron transport multicopper oxidase FET3 [Triangularia verruculosa]
MDHGIVGLPSSLLWIFLLLFGFCLPTHAQQPGVAQVVEPGLQEPTPWHTFFNDKTHVYNFNVSWILKEPGAPDGSDISEDVFKEHGIKPVIGINGKWPLPVIEVTVGDRIVINLLNQLEDQSTSLHFHGIYLRNETHMDGPVHVSQCPIPPGARFTYNFTVTQPGIYWYHSHVHGQYPDGLRGPLIVHDPENPFQDKYNETQLLTVSDWYRQPMPELIDKFISKTNPSGAEPVPDLGLFNDDISALIKVKPSTTYRFDVINMGAFANVYLWFEGHNMTVIMIDGVYTQLVETSMIYVTPGQRYSFLITTKAGAKANFPFVASMDLNLFDKPSDSFYPNISGWLIYDDTKELPLAVDLSTFNPMDDFLSLAPLDDQPLLGDPDQVVQLDVMMDNLGDGANYAFFNNITYVPPKVPTLYTVMSSKDLATNPVVYGSHTHTIVLKKDDIVEIVLNNLDPGIHPFHLHGHNFQVVWRSEPDAGPFQDSNTTSSSFAPVPMRRDTVVVHPNGNLVLRFKADNPGVWLFHCHIEWHVQSGLVATFVEAPLEIQESLTIPADHLAVCKDLEIPTEGNAAGHTDDFLNLDGENAPPNRLPDGYTGPGIVALVFSCLTGLLGMITIAWYGFAEGANDGEAKNVRIEGQQDGPGDIELTDIRTDSTLVDEERVNELCRGGNQIKATGGGM